MTQRSNRFFLYTYVRHVDEQELCKMEMRAFFQQHTDDNYLISPIQIDPSRSPFMKERLFCQLIVKDYNELLQKVEQSIHPTTSFKVHCLHTMNFGQIAKWDHAKRRKIEKEIGERLPGQADLKQPNLLFGVAYLNGQWLFGPLEKSTSVWRHHQQKPRMYSTALSTRLARAVVNIGIPHPASVRAIDPCCGIGTVLVEAHSMGIDMLGSDINPLVCHGARENLQYFGYEPTVHRKAIADITEKYDVAMIDMPYNLMTHITPADQFDIVKHARRIAKRVVMITIDPMDHTIEEVGFHIVDRCIAKKGRFERHVLLLQ